MAKALPARAPQVALDARPGRKPALKPPTVSPNRWQVMVFCDHYLRTFNAALAAAKAGYSEASAAPRGAELLRHASIVEELSRRSLERIGAAELRDEDIIRVLMEIAFMDDGDLYAHGIVVTGKDGQKRAVVTRTAFLELPPRIRRAYYVAGENADGSLVLKPWNKMEAAKLLMLHRRLVNVSDTEVTAHALLRLSDEQFDKRAAEIEAEYQRLKAARERLYGSTIDVTPTKDSTK